MSLRTGDSTSEQVVKGMPLLSLRTSDSTPQQVVRGTSLASIMATRIPTGSGNEVQSKGVDNRYPYLPSLEAFRKKRYHLKPTCTQPGRRNLHERIGKETRSGETAGDAKGVPEQVKAVPWDGALCRFSGRCPRF